jgi:hypothetical protein
LPVFEVYYDRLDASLAFELEEVGVGLEWLHDVFALFAEVHAVYLEEAFILFGRPWLELVCNVVLKLVVGCRDFRLGLLSERVRVTVVHYVRQSWLFNLGINIQSIQVFKGQFLACT